MKKMQFFIMPSLEQISYTKIAITLWNLDDVRDLKVRFCSQLLFHFEIQAEWERIENKVAEKVSSLFLPEDIKEKLRNIIKPIGNEILRWWEYHERFLSDERFVEKCLNEISWTSVGKIDREKTVKRLIQEGSIDIGIRYKLACKFCFESDILKLWTELPGDLKNTFYSEWTLSTYIENELVCYWSFYVNGDLDMLKKQVSLPLQRSFYVVMFENALRSGSKKAVKYFLCKLSHPVKGVELVKAARRIAKSHFEFGDGMCVPSKDYSDMLCFLLSQMNDKQLRQIFKWCPALILKCLLRWPLQSLFIEVAKHVCQSISEKGFYSVLFYLLRYIIISGIKDYNYQELLGEFWQQSPIHLKKHVLHTCPGYLLLTLLQTDDHRNISLILQGVRLEERELLLFGNIGILKDVVEAENWDLLKFYILQCISSKKKMIEFKQDCDKYVIYYGHTKWKKFVEILSALIESFDVHNFVKHEYNPSKKLCI